MSTNVTVVVGGQFGSEGKGAISAHIGKTFDERDVAVRVAGPNAGHTVWGNGREWKLRSLPTPAVTSPCQLHIAAGSEIDLEILIREICDLDEAGYNVSERLTIHPSATLIRPNHMVQETSLINLIGSTGKGIGAARADRIMRGADLAETSSYLKPFISTDGPFELDARNVLVEGTQGYGLGLHTEFYPQVTSSDCRAIDFLAMAGISPWSQDVRELKVVIVARVYPIRVAGNSGPLFGETTWADLDLPTERTTVTNNVRRVGMWDSALIEEAILANGGGNFHPDVTLALTMLDHRFPQQRDRAELDDEPLEFIQNLEMEHQTHITLVGTGPETVVER